MIFHPSGQHVLLDRWSADVRLFAASDGTEGPAFSVEGMGQVDVDSEDGRLLFVVHPPPSFVDQKPGAGAPPTACPGIYVASADGADPVRVPTPD